MVKMKFVRRVLTCKLRFRGSRTVDSFLQVGVVVCKWIDVWRVLVEMGLVFADGLKFRGSWWSMFNCLSMKCDRES